MPKRVMLCLPPIGGGGGRGGGGGADVDVDVDFGEYVDECTAVDVDVAIDADVDVAEDVSKWTVHLYTEQRFL